MPQITEKRKNQANQNLKRNGGNQTMNIMEQHEMVEKVMESHKLSDFKIMTVECELPTRDKIKILIDSEKILKEFMNLFIKKVENSQAKELLIRHTVSDIETVNIIIENILNLKEEELNVKIREEYYIMRPSNRYEKRKYKDRINEIGKYIFKEEDIAQKLVSPWLRTLAMFFDDDEFEANNNLCYI